LFSQPAQVPPSAPQVIVEKPQPVQLPAKPPLAILDLKPETSAQDVLKAYIESLRSCIGYSAALEALIPRE